MSTAILAALVSALASAGPNTVSELIVVPPKLVEELVVIAHPRCLEASRTPMPEPRVVSTFPAEGQVVPPGLLAVRVTFDRPMTCSGFIENTANLPSPCPITEQKMLMSFDHKTVRTLCITQPNTEYAITVGGGAQGFVSLDGQRAYPLTVHFRTSGEQDVVTVPDALAEDKAAPARIRQLRSATKREEPEKRAALRSAAAPNEISGLTVTAPKCLSYPAARKLWLESRGPGGPDAFTVNAMLAPNPAGTGHRAGPNPGTEAWLSSMFEYLEAGDQNYAAMSPELADATRQQFAGPRGMSKALGKFVGVRFLYVSCHDLDVYEVEWQCAKGQWGVGPLEKSGRVSQALGRLVAYGSVNLLD